MKCVSTLLAERDCALGVSRMAGEFRHALTTFYQRVSVGLDSSCGATGGSAKWVKNEGVVTDRPCGLLAALEDTRQVGGTRPRYGASCRWPT